MGPGGERVAAVAATVSRVRAIARAEGETRAALDAIKDKLIALAARTELFPPAHFPVAGGPVRHGLPPVRGRRSALRALRLRRHAGQGAAAAQPHDLGGDLRRLRRRAQRLLRAHRQPRHAGHRPPAPDRRADRDARQRRRLPARRFPHDRGDWATSPRCTCMSTAAASSTCPSASSSPRRDGGRLQGLPGQSEHRDARGRAPPSSRRCSTTAASWRCSTCARRACSRRATCCSPLPAAEPARGRASPRWCRGGRRRIVLCDDDDGLAHRAATEADAFRLPQPVGARRRHRRRGRRRATSCSAASTCRARRSARSVEHEAGTPHLAAEELKARLDRGEDVVILDSRPMNEFRAHEHPRRHRLPRRRAGPPRLRDGRARPETLVVVNCAGRTRSIIGAQSLINAGVPNRGRGAEERHDGLAAGRPRARRAAQTRHAPAPGRRRRARRRSDAAEARRRALRRDERSTAQRWRGSRPRRTRSLYLLRRAQPRGIRGGPSAGRRARRPAGSWCSRPTTMSARATRGSCWSTMTACAPA